MYDSSDPWCPPMNALYTPPPRESRVISDTFGSLINVPFDKIKEWNAPYVRINIRVRGGGTGGLAGLNFLVKVGSGNYQREFWATGLSDGCLTFDVAATGGITVDYVSLDPFPGYVTFNTGVVDYQVVPIPYPQQAALVPHIIHVEDIDDRSIPRQFAPVLFNPNTIPVEVNCYAERLSLALERAPAGAFGDVTIFAGIRSDTFNSDSQPIIPQVAYNTVSGSYENGVEVRGSFFELLGWMANGIGAGTIRATLTEWIRTY